MFKLNSTPSLLWKSVLLVLMGMLVGASPAQPAPPPPSLPAPLHWTRRPLYAPHDFLPTTAALKVDSHDQPHLAYGGEQLYYATSAEAGWKVEVVDPAPNSGAQAVLALDSSDQPHILYRDTVSDTVKYAHRAGGEWLIQPVTIGNDQPEEYSFTLTSDDRPCLSYYESTQGALKIACWDGSGWQSQIIETYIEQEAVVAEQPDASDPALPPPPPPRSFLSSLALDEANAPRLAIIDQYSASLQYA